MKKTLKLSILTIFVTLALAASLASCSARGVDAGEARAVLSDSGEEVTVEIAFTEQVINANADKTLYLFRIDAGAAAYDLASLSPSAEMKMTDYARVTVPLFENGSSALYGSFVFATYDGLKNSYSVLSDRLYVENPERLAPKDGEAQKFESIKGVNAESTSLAISLGVSHSLIDIKLEDYIAAADDEHTVRHEFDGTSSFFSRDAIAALDEKLASLDRAGSAIYLRIGLGTAEKELPDEKKFLSYPATAAGEELYPINFGNRAAFSAYSAFCDLIADRYAVTADISFILGRASNSAELGDEQSELASGAFASEYAAALRVTYNILRSRTAGGEVFASIDNRLTATRSSEHLSAEAFLVALDLAVGRSSDFPWGVAAECGAGSVSGDRVWYDSENVSLITPTNLSGLTESLLGRDDLMFGGWARPAIISDLLIATVDGSRASESNQAASYAFTYYQAVKDGKLSALIYGDVFDGESSSFGLLGALGEKEICDMIRAIDTDADINDRVGELIGGAWNALAENRELYDRVVRGKYLSGAATLGSSEGYELSPLVGFERGELDNFSTVGSVRLMLDKVGGISKLTASFDPESGEKPSGIAVFGIDPSLIGGEYIMLPLTVRPDGDAVVESYELTLTLLQNDPAGESRNYSSSVKVTPGAAVTAVFDISAFSEAKLDDDVTLLLTVSGSDGLPFTLKLDEVLSAKQPKTVIWIIVLVSLCVLVLAGAVTVFIIWFRKNYDIDFSALRREKKDKKAKKEGKN